jgi:hypothetical protein
MSAVVKAIGNAVEFVADTASDVVDNALKDPIGTMAKVAAISTGQFELLPVISAGSTLANGGSLTDAVKSGAITYAAGQVGGWAGDEVSAASNYGTELGSQQTAMLAAQDAGMGMGTTLGGAVGSAAGAGTGALLSGGNVGQAIMGGLAGYGASLGLNAAGQVVNQAGDVIANSYDEFMANQTADQPGDYPQTEADLAAADTELGGIPSPGMIGDQPGDYPQTEADLAAADNQLAAMPGLDASTPIGDQPGDYPQTPEELALQDELMSQVGDQPGDYDTTQQEIDSSEQTLASMPGVEDATTANPDVAKALKNYASNAFKNQLINNLMGGKSSYRPSFGINPGGASSALSGLGGLTGLGLNFTPTSDTTTESQVSRFTPSTDTLFNPLSNMTWAPQTKIGGLGAAGKYINQEQDTYFVNPEQAKKEQNYYNTGWMTDEDKARAAQEDQMYYDYANPTDNPWEQTNPVYAAEGGAIGHNPEFYSEGGASMANRYVKGEGDGTSDSVPAMLASGEFVIPADVVSSLGNGDNDAGALTLDEFLKVIRAHKRAADPGDLPEDSKGPLAYLQEALTKARK